MTLRTPILGASLIALGLSVSIAEGKAISYEIDGQRYSYESTNREQAELARKRMSAAKAAAAIRAKAAEERAANPLVRLFGSKTQSEAKAAEAQLQEWLATGSRAVENSGTQRQAATRGAPVPSKNVLAPKSLAGAQPEQAKDQAIPANTKGAGPGAKHATAGSALVNVETIHFDFASGIKTAQMADGTVEEDLFDPKAAMLLKGATLSGGPRNMFLNEPAQNSAAATGSQAGEKR